MKMKNTSILGLKKGTVELFDHTILWTENANETIVELKKIFGNTAIDIQHVGSTAIKNIKAKPIIDIVVGLDELSNLDEFIDKLSLHNFFHRPFMQDDVLFTKGNIIEETRTHHIHIVKHGNEVWNNLIIFRDYLNDNSTEAKKYEKLKVDLQKINKNNRILYTEKKEAYIIYIIEKAKELKNII